MSIFRKLASAHSSSEWTGIQEPQEFCAYERATQAGVQGVGYRETQVLPQSIEGFSLFLSHGQSRGEAANARPAFDEPFGFQLSVCLLYCRLADVLSPGEGADGGQRDVW